MSGEQSMLNAVKALFYTNSFNAMGHCRVPVCSRFIGRERAN